MKYLSALILVSFFGFYTQAQKFKGLDKSPLDMIEYPGIRGQKQWARILYGRPQLKGRDIESLVPEGELWRMGANEATELTLFDPMIIGGVELPVGSYSLYAIPYEGEITIIVNKATHVWGSYYNKKMDVARISVPLNTESDYLEALSMIFEKGSGPSGMNLHIGWGYYRARISFTK